MHGNSVQLHGKLVAMFFKFLQVSTQNKNDGFLTLNAFIKPMIF